MTISNDYRTRQVPCMREEAGRGQCKLESRYLIRRGQLSVTPAINAAGNVGPVLLELPSFQERPPTSFSCGISRYVYVGN